MEQFAISIKMRYKDDGAMGRQLCFPKGIIMPECLREQQAVPNMNKKQVNCQACGKEKLGEMVINAVNKAEESKRAPKYVCKKSGMASCSLDCYKKNLSHYQKTIQV